MYFFFYTTIKKTKTDWDPTGLVGRWAGEKSHSKETAKVPRADPVFPPQLWLEAWKSEVAQTVVVRRSLRGLCWTEGAGSYGSIQGTHCLPSWLAVVAFSASMQYQASPTVTEPMWQSMAQLPGPGSMRTEGLRRLHNGALAPEHRGLRPPLKSSQEDWSSDSFQTVLPRAWGDGKVSTRHTPKGIKYFAMLGKKKQGKTTVPLNVTEIFPGLCNLKFLFIKIG